jgi:hypothetical protein
MPSDTTEVDVVLNMSTVQIQSTSIDIGLNVVDGLTVVYETTEIDIIPGMRAVPDMGYLAQNRYRG